MAEKIPSRQELAREDTWAIEDLYETDEAWLSDLEKLKALGARLPGYAGKISADAKTLLEYQRLGEEISLLLDSLANYAQRKSDEDTRNPVYQDLTGKLTKVWVQLGADTAFEVPELLSISDERMEEFYREEPELQLYRRHFDVIRRKKEHILSESEEKLLAMAGEMAGTPEEVYSLFADADLTFRPALDRDGNEHPITQGSYIAAMESPDRTLRKNAFESLYAGFGAYKNSVAAMLCGQVKQLEFFSKARRYASPLEASLDATEVPVGVYHALIEAVHQNLDKLHRYMRLRKKLLGVDELHMYDLYTPLIETSQKRIPFDEAKKTVAQALGVMGERYGAILQEGFQNRWIDVYENTGKRGGAYCTGNGWPHPYVLLNHKDNLDSMFTLVHEMGHAMHTWHSCKYQPVNTAEYVIFVAEVASTCNEILLMRHLLGKTTDRKQRAYLINHFLDQFKGTVYRQTMFAEFELEMGKLVESGEALTADALSEKYHALNKLYFGPDMVSDDEIALEWTRIPHFYYNYYVFQYATSFSAAVAIANRILREGESAVKDYKKFLSGGCSKEPVELLRDMGVDMRTPAPVNDALSLFGELIDELSELLG